MSESTMSLISMFIPLILLFVLMYFMLIRPQKKKDKETQKMRNNVQVGDEVTTIGGIIGIVVSLKEDTLVIETAGERNKIRIKRWAIQSNDTVHDDAEA
jgi:preprotein translocase subunit YajC